MRKDYKMPPPFDLRTLEAFDTPTICNALEMIEPERRRYGYTTHDIFGLNLDMAPKVGIAFTATMRSANRPPVQGQALKQERLRYYEYMSESSEHPKICVMQDLDGHDAGKGPFWGEFNTRVHRSLGFDAIITDGSIRDVTNLPEDILILSRGLRPSHGFVHVVNFGQQVNVFGMAVTPGQVVHADIHGAVTFPFDLADDVADKARQFMADEAPIIEACRAGRLTYPELASLYMQRPAFGDSKTTTNLDSSKAQF
jgi:regulator of RNase E activity RraA